ncbi:MAG: bifunctional phosphoribosylaminoimidazolecarboxamide formyltransferase/IMP cyclohydrolase [Ilumatobacteraceae bacterium]
MPRALLSVYDKTGIAEFASALHTLGWTLLSSGGTAAHIAQAGVPVTDVADVTGTPPILDHRVVTLHPKVHGGILADRDNAQHMDELRQFGIDEIDLVVVNLYPFGSKPGIDLIDVGGPAMVRAAAKNFAHVGVVVDTADYADVLEMIEGGYFGISARRVLAQKAFRITSAYDAAIASWLADENPDRASALVPPILTMVAERAEILRYGENPHQIGARYRLPGVESWWDSAVQLNGKEMSYLNVLDTEAAWQLVSTFDRPAAVVVKHANPCGVALDSTIHGAYVKAHAADPISAFGGIVAVNGEVNEATAQEISQVFTEVVIAPSFSAEALEILCEKENLRLIEAVAPYHSMAIDVRSIDGGLLVQQVDEADEPLDDFTVVTERAPSDVEWQDLLLAWQTVTATWSNAIVLAKSEIVVGVGGGQPNRVDAARIAITRAGDSARGAVAASDAFFPFGDTVEELAAAGVTAIIQPGGSVRDSASTSAANTHGIAMVFTGTRHFRH